MKQDTLIYGERPADLLPSLLKLSDSAKIDSDGCYVFSGVLDPVEAGPLLRALLRAEAELLLEEADEIGSKSYPQRSEEQRAADALVRLVGALGTR